MAAWVRDMCCNFCSVKTHKIVNNSTTTTFREKISTDLESLYFQKFFDAHLTKFKNNKILSNKISHRCLLTVKLSTECKILIILKYILTHLDECTDVYGLIPWNFPVDALMSLSFLASLNNI